MESRRRAGAASEPVNMNRWDEAKWGGQRALEGCREPKVLRKACVLQKPEKPGEGSPDACDVQGASPNLDVSCILPADPSAPPGPAWVSELGCAATSSPSNSQTEGR